MFTSFSTKSNVCLFLFQPRIQMLKQWFRLTLPSCALGIIVATYCVVIYDEKVLIGVSALVYYLYKWYALWIVTEVYKEIRKQSPCSSSVFNGVISATTTTTPRGNDGDTPRLHQSQSPCPLPSDF